MSFNPVSFIFSWVVPVVFLSYSIIVKDFYFFLAILFFMIGVNIGNIFSIRNEFYNLYNDVEKSKNNIEVEKKEYNEAIKKLREMVNKYFDLNEESEINLFDLVENHSELRSDLEVRRLVDEIQVTRRVILKEESYFNDMAEKYNNYGLKFFNFFRPKNLPKEVLCVNSDNILDIK